MWKLSGLKFVETEQTKLCGGRVDILMRKQTWAYGLCLNDVICRQTGLMLSKVRHMAVEPKITITYCRTIDINTLVTGSN